MAFIYNCLKRHKKKDPRDLKLGLLVFNTTFSNISAISWQPVLMEEAGVPGENHRPWTATGKLYHLQSRVHPFWQFTKRSAN
jgi:hypothetical protein